MDKVLVVDDNLDFLNDLKTGLKPYSSQFELLSVSDADEAVQVLRTEPITVLITELNMPEIDALALLIFMSNNLSQVPCILITEQGKPKIRNYAENQYIFSYIAKPVIFEEVGSAIMEGPVP